MTMNLSGPSHYWSVKELRKAYERGLLAPKDAILGCLDRIQKLDGVLGSFLSVNEPHDVPEGYGGWRHQGSGIEAVPYALKDIIDVRGIATTCHSRARSAHIAPKDSDIAAALNEAGALLIGKNSLHEFAVGGPAFDLPYPPARNPWNPRLHPGGSSSGSAVAVAAGLSYFSIGTDTRGSVRHPATATGIYGFKPSFGGISMVGVVPLAKSLDHAGTLTRSAHDIACVMACLASTGQDRSEYARLAMRAEGDAISGMTVGVMDPFTYELDPHPDISRGLDRTIAELAKAGVKVKRIESRALARFSECAKVIVGAEAYTYHGEHLDAHPEQYCRLTRERVGRGRSVTLQAYVRARDAQRDLRHHLASVHAGVDFTLSYSSLEFPCEIDEPERIAETYDKHARDPYNVTGFPAMSVPVGLSPSGLPIGLQFAAASGRDTELVDFVMALEGLGIARYLPPPVESFV